MFNVIEYIKEYFGNKKSDESCEFDFGDSLKNVLDKRFDREGRAYDNLSERYDNLDDLPSAERNRLLRKEFLRILEEDEREDLKNKSSLRSIKTLRTKEEIKDAIRAGHKVLKQKVKPSKEIHITDLYIKDKETGEISIEPYSFHSLSINDDRYKVVKKKRYYPYKFPSKVAAYLLPDDLEMGERVILEDLIEDIVGASRPSGTYRQDSAEAKWDGKKFIVDCHSYDVGIAFG